MDFIEDINFEEERAVKEFQLRMKNAIPQSLTGDKTLFYRFLKARDFDLDKAEKMLCKHLRWRKVNQIDTILEDFKPKECFKNHLDPNFFGYSKEGHVVLYSAAGKVDVNDVFKSLKMNDFVKHFLWMSEKNVSLQKMNNHKTGLKGYQCVFIMDLDKLTFASVTNKLIISALLQFINTLQDNYPERMKAIFVINSPSYYVLAWSIVKTFMSNAMIKKINFYGSNGWEDKLFELVDADVIPAFLGGNRTDPDGDPLCKTVITNDIKIPKSLYLTSDERYFTNSMKVRKVTVPASEKKEVYVDVNDVKLRIQWEFFVKGKDIGFGIFFLNSKHGIKEEVIPIQKYSTSDGTEKGFYKCPTAGRYIILLDNSYSWISSKDVEYCVTILE